MTSFRYAVALTTAALTIACNPPAADRYAERAALFERQERAQPPPPLPSPDTDGAIWSDSRQSDRIIYGKPEETPLLALACKREGVTARLALTRLAPAPENGQALIALIGNGHIARWPMDATSVEETTVWQGEVALDDPDIGVLTGRRRVEATLPGTGTVLLNPSARPAQLIERCERFHSPQLLDEPEPGEEQPLGQ